MIPVGLGFQPPAILGSQPPSAATFINNVYSDDAIAEAVSRFGVGMFGRTTAVPVASARTLNVTPFTVMAGIPGVLLCPTFVALWDVRGGVAMTATSTWTLRYIGGTAVASNLAISLLAGASVNTFRFARRGLTDTQAQTTDPDDMSGVGLEITGSSGFTGGDTNQWVWVTSGFAVAAKP